MGSYLVIIAVLIIFFYASGEEGEQQRLHGRY